MDISKSSTTTGSQAAHVIAGSTAANYASGFTPVDQRRARIGVFETPKEVGCHAASKVVELLEGVVTAHGSALLVVACAPSQHETWEAIVPLLKVRPSLVKNVTFINMDEYVGISPDHAESFNGNLQRRFFDRLKDTVGPDSVHLIRGDGDPQAAVGSISEIIRAFSPQQIVVMGGFGTDGHLAFDDYPVTAIKPNGEVPVATVRPIAEVARQQQVTDGCFAALEEVPTHCITLTCEFFRHYARGGIVLAAKGEHKAEAADSLLRDPVPQSPVSQLYRSIDGTTDFPARPWVFLDSKAGKGVRSQAYNLEDYSFRFGNWECKE